MTIRYIAVIDGEAGAFGVVVPDCPGCVAMGDTLEHALDNATEALGAWVEAVEGQGDQIRQPRSPSAIRALAPVGAESAPVIYAAVPLIRRLSRPVTLDVRLDAGLLAAIDETANRLAVTRSNMVEMLARAALPGFG